MELGLMTEPQLGMTYDELLTLARFADDGGLDVFARSDHYLFPKFEGPHATDAFATLGGLARETKRVELAVLVSPVTFRHPAVITKMAGTIDEMSGGRFALGLGTGWMKDEHDGFGLRFPETSERFEMLEEALAYTKAALSGDTFLGEHYRLEADDVHPRPAGHLPLIVGGSGPRKTPRLAGTYADEFNVSLLPADQMAARIERAREAAATAGRDPDSLKISVMVSAVVGESEDDYDAKLAYVAHTDPLGRDASAIGDRLAERGAPLGGPERAAEAMGRLAEAGVQRFYLQWFGGVEVDLLGSMFQVLRNAS